MKEGSIVTRKSYNNDICFKIETINNDIVILKGMSYRIIADANINDLQVLSPKEYKEKEYNLNEIVDDTINNFIYERYSKSQFNRGEPKDQKPGKILHVDGDNYCLKCCLEKYKKLQVPAQGVYLKEELQPSQIINLLKEYSPDILVITGHDNLKRGNNTWSNIENYRNSKYFIETVKNARKYNSNYDQLVIFAGGCQSYYDEIIEAGANFASSPNRILIHHIDPVLVSYNISIASIREFIDAKHVAKDTFGGIGGIGGIETRGKCREISPNLKLKKVY
ncbi:sporulation peptidase YabG [Romboutsia sp.]|uniref:sporulation peptidase YabG n=1 Tax=Romboutsia sp. TaxID=1965302 RepID=UPI002D12FE1C|nr:sporulation peptidase YabG [Romboutsia sp.]HSQ87884.1 sporulation peptidase YabG [Romboutsia sp.]